MKFYILLDKRKNRFTYLDRFINDLDKASRYLTEDYMFDGDDDMEYYQDDMQGQIPNRDSQNGDENVEQKAMHAKEVIQHEPIIQKIRETAIEGLRKYSEDPTSSIYEFFKKVFLESDKVLTDDGSSK